MQSTSTLISQLANDYPALTFKAGERFEWQPEQNTILYDVTDPSFAPRLLHELGHSILGHKAYERDIELIAMERDAWQQARMTLGPQYGITIESDHIDTDMDTYRDWLHERSVCPHCQSSGIQIKKHTYKCVTCQQTWQVNEARSCALRRYKG